MSTGENHNTMFRFFRQIRSDLIERKQTGRYLAYAFGEIILVIIGILLALQINNCNDQRKNREENRLLLGQVLEENRLNRSELEVDTAYRRSLNQTLGKFVNFLKDDRLEETDSLQYFLSEMFRSTAYSFTTNSLETYIQSNRNENPDLIRELVSVQSWQKDLSTISLKGMEIKFDYFYEPLASEVDFTNLEIKDLEWLSSLEFRNKIQIIRNVEEEIGTSFEGCLRQQIRTDSVIRAFLKK